jgi:hypothetical protein
MIGIDDLVKCRIKGLHPEFVSVYLDVCKPDFYQPLSYGVNKKLYSRLVAEKKINYKTFDFRPFWSIQNVFVYADELSMLNDFTDNLLGLNIKNIHATCGGETMIFINDALTHIIGKDDYSYFGIENAQH